MKKIKVYTTPTCRWCHKAKDFLNEKKIEFENFDVSSDEKARNDMIKKSGQVGVPVLDIDGKIIVGFDQEAINKELEA